MMIVVRENSAIIGKLHICKGQPGIDAATQCAPDIQHSSPLLGNLITKMKGRGPGQLGLFKEHEERRMSH